MPNLPDQRELIAIIAVSLGLVLPAHARQTDELQKQLQQLRQQYEQTSREMQERITALELQIQVKERARPDESKQEGTVSALELAAEEAGKKRRVLET